MFKCNLKDLELLLISFNVPKHSTIIIHSSLFRFGLINGGVNSIYKVLRNVFDETYTLLMPTFTFSYGESREWSCLYSKSETGALTEFMRELNPKNRSINPFHSIVVDGPNKDYLLGQISESSFGQDSIFEKLYSLGAYNLSLGIDFIGGATFCHYTEEYLKVPYRFYKSFPGNVLDNRNEKIEVDFKMYVRIIEKEYYYKNNWNVFWKEANRKGLVNYTKFNNRAPVFLMNIRDSNDFLAEKIFENPFYVAEKIQI